MDCFARPRSQVGSLRVDRLYGLNMRQLMAYIMAREHIVMWPKLGKLPRGLLWYVFQ